jgi:hypothetical protein
MRRNRLYRKISNIINNIKFKLSNLDYGEIIILVWVIFWFVSLFSNWIVELKDTPDLWNANWFSDRTWSPWYFIIIVIAIVIFNMFSKQKKEKMKLYWNIHFDNNWVYINSWILISIISILCINFISWLASLDSQNIYWKWPIISLTWWIAIMIWWFLLRKNNNFKINTFIDDTEWQANKEIFNKENNMKLPF